MRKNFYSENPLFFTVFLLAVILSGREAHAQNPSIQMLPPTDYAGAICSGAHAGLLTWDGMTAIKCVPGSVSDAAGNLAVSGNLTVGQAIGIGTGSPQTALDVNGEIRASNSGSVCGPKNKGAMRFDSASNAFLGCNGTSWTSLGKPHLSNSENITCNQGLGVIPNCTFTGSLLNTISYIANSAQPHDLCLLSSTAGWIAGFWGQCTVSGTPGGIWTLTSAVHLTQVTCSMACYDFQ